MGIVKTQHHKNIVGELIGIKSSTQKQLNLNDSATEQSFLTSNNTQKHFLKNEIHCCQRNNYFCTQLQSLGLKSARHKECIQPLAHGQPFCQPRSAGALSVLSAEATHKFVSKHKAESSAFALTVCQGRQMTIQGFW